MGEGTAGEAWSTLTTSSSAAGGGGLMGGLADDTGEDPREGVARGDSITSTT